MGEMYRNLTKEGVLVPNGFAVTATAYRHILEASGLEEKLHELLDGLDYDDMRSLQERGAARRKLIHNLELPEDLRKEIIESYAELKKEYGDDVSLAVRSSATAEDSPEASFAGQNDTYLNIK